MAATELEAGRNSNSEREQLAADQLALARSRAYDLLSQLYLVGVTAENLSQVQAVPDLAEQLDLPLDADEAAADHQHLFGFNVHPYQSYFLDPAGLLGGPVTEGVARTYQRLGFQAEVASESADHVGLELGFMAFLSAAEAQALEDGRTRLANDLADQQLTFMLAHLLAWIGPLTLAIGQQGHGFYRALARVTFDVVQEHAAELSARLKRPLAAEFILPAAPAILDDEATGLKEIAEFLLAPAYSGVYLGRDDIGRLARQQAIPRGFGERRQLLVNLMRSAATYDALGDVIDGLQSVVGRWLAGYDEMIEQGEMGHFAAGWRARAAGTASLLQQMGGHIEGSG